MYHYALSVKDVLKLESVPAFEKVDPVAVPILNESKELHARDVDEIYQYLTTEERAEFERQKEYMSHGPGRVEAILNEEMERLYAQMQTKIAKQDEDFFAKMPPPGKK